MCFSAPVSFTASAVLAITGCILAFRVKSKRLIPLALVPWFFAIQQAAEGVVWLYLPEATSAKNIFLFFAYAVWPIWVPFSMWVIEDHAKRKQWLGVCLGIGIVIGTFLALMIPETQASCNHSSIHYLQNVRLDQFAPAAFTFYAISIFVPFFVSSLKKIWIVGVLIAISAMVTYLVDKFSVTSVWCFCAAVISLSLLFILKKSVMRK